VKKFCKKFTFSLLTLIIILGIIELTSQLIFHIKYSKITENSQKIIFKSNLKNFKNINFPYKKLNILNKIYYSHFNFSDNNILNKNKIIICAGDSCTEGWIDSNNRYPLILEYLLKKKVENIRVINAGLGGATSELGLNQYNNFFFNMKHSVLIWFYVWNDMWQGEDPQNFLIKSANIRNFFFKSFLIDIEKSKTFVLLRKLLFPPKINFKKNNTPPKKFEKNLIRLIKLTQKKSIKLILLTAPSNIPDSLLSDKKIQNLKIDQIYPLSGMLKIYNNIIRNTAKKYNITLIDLNQLIKQYKNSDEFFCNDHIHYTYSGSEFIAKEIFSKIID
jgi:lysophospholipase L1-like esterase